MDTTEFYKLVLRMRNKQKEFFKTKNPVILRECFLLERQVDEQAAKYLFPITKLEEKLLNKVENTL